VSGNESHRAIEAVWRMEAARVIAGLTRMVRDVGLAEDFAQEALVAALEQWPASGIPANPGAWLTLAAKRRAIDHFRYVARTGQKHEEIGRSLFAIEQAAPDFDAALDDHIGDDVLRLIFVACHPVLAPESRAALTLRVVAGLTTDEIARAFLAPESTVAQRIVRAKRTLAEKRIPFEVPRGLDLGARLGSVLEVIYLIFNEGYSATAGQDLIRVSLCEEGLRIGRILAELEPHEPEVHGLVALMEIQASRSRARVGPGGDPILLLDQNRALWDQLLIRRGLAALDRAERLSAVKGPYRLQAEMAACHARALTAAETDWARIVALYGELAALTPSPIIELNRAVAVSMVSGPQAALDLLDPLLDEPLMKNYHLLPSVRGDLLSRLDRHGEAQAEFERAASMTRNSREQKLLTERARLSAQIAGAQMPSILARPTETDGPG
jgi:RNA polymerase sigma-70 factor, ECF subfamily